MSEPSTRSPKQDEGGLYEIRIHGHLDERWAGWFEGMTLSLEPAGDTLIRGQVLDQAALFGLLRKLRDTGMPLVSVNRIPTDWANPGGDKS